MNVALYFDALYEQAVRRERIFRDRKNILEWPDQTIRTLFRFERHNLLRLIDSLSPRLLNVTVRNRAIPSELQICIGLHYLATGTFQTTIAEMVGVSQKSVSKCYWEFVQAIIQEYVQVIQFENPQEIQNGFLRSSRMSQICGAIDCTHVKIIRPHADLHPNEYINRKGWHSINVQCVCDSNGKFLDVSAEWPGCTHDNVIFKNSSLCQRFFTGEFGNSYLIGDGGYAISKHLITPYRNPLSDSQVLFNKDLSSSRVVIEMAFGRLKRRFACLYRVLQMPLERVPKVIMACCILHNLALSFNDPDEVEHAHTHEIEAPNEVSESIDRNANEGKRRRMELTRLFDI